MFLPKKNANKIFMVRFAICKIIEKKRAKALIAVIRIHGSKQQTVQIFTAKIALYVRFELSSLEMLKIFQRFCSKIH